MKNPKNASMKILLAAACLLGISAMPVLADPPATPSTTLSTALVQHIADFLHDGGTHEAAQVLLEDIRGELDRQIADAKAADAAKTQTAAAEARAAKAEAALAAMTKAAADKAPTDAAATPPQPPAVTTPP